MMHSSLGKVRSRMFRPTLVGVVATLGVVATALAVTPATAAPGRLTQSITFTSAAPTDAVINRTSNLGDYVPTARATSGLPVTLSVDPASTGCTGSPGVIGQSDPGAITVRWTAAGTCIVHADQGGNSRYLTAPRVTQKFVISRESVTLTLEPASKGLIGLTPTTFRAALRHETRFGPGFLTVGYPEQTITFSVGGKVLCSATTVAQGDLFDSTAVASCQAPVGLVNALVTKSYVASYAGNSYSLPASATGKLK